jgi:hypothetical protein
MAHSGVVSSSPNSDELLTDRGGINSLPYDLLFGLADKVEHFAVLDFFRAS